MRLKSKPLLITCMLVAACTHYAQQVPFCFSSATFTGSNELYSSVIAGDFNGDGIPDIAANNYSNTTLTSIIALQDGSFTTLNKPLSGVGLGSCRQMIGGDFNNDGIDDVLLFNQSSHICFYPGTATNGFGAPVNSPISGLNCPNSLVTHDFNQDGKLDLAIHNGCANNIYLLAGGGNGSFTLLNTLNVASLSYGCLLRLCDVNSDGDPDLVVMNSSIPGISCLVATGNGNFAAPVTSPVNSYYVNTLLSFDAADINNDNSPDIVITRNFDDSISVMIGLGTGSFAPAYTRRMQGLGNPGCIQLADVNRDGNKDLLISHTVLAVYPGQGTGSFVTSPQLTFNQVTPGMPGTNDNFRMTAADFDDDGLVDLVGAENTGSTGISLLSNNHGTVTGQITNNPAVSSQVTLYKKLNGEAKLKNARSLAANGGNFNFPSVSTGMYILLAEPYSSSHQDTYFPNATYWKGASAFSVGCQTSNSKNFSVQSISTATGNCMLKGTIKQGAGYKEGSTGPGNPIGGVVVKGGKNPGGNIVSRTTTNSNGQYSLSLPQGASGESYFVMVDIPGLDTIITYHRVLDQPGMAFLNLDFIADSNSVFPVDINVSVRERLSGQVVEVFPNPSTGILNIRGTSMPARFDLSDMQGRLMMSVNCGNAASVQESVVLDLGGLENGIYLLTVRDGGAVYCRQVLVAR